MIWRFWYWLLAGGIFVVLAGMAAAVLLGMAWRWGWKASRKPLGRMLRRAGNRLDPPVTSEPVTPLEFIGTDELAHEIRRRASGGCLLSWCDPPSPGRPNFQLVVGMHRDDFDPWIEHIRNTLRRMEDYQ